MRRLPLVIALLALAVPAGAASAPAEPALDFYPQSGILWRDIYPNNFVDLQPGPGLLDFDCGTMTYDGHTGTDSDLRSFAEKVIGVPVYAAVDGRVSSVQDGAPDENRGGANPGPDNHVEIDSPGGVRMIYGHLKRNSIPVRVGDEVVAGQQIGETASSGNSTGPHLHFSVLRGDRVIEPFAGRCRPGPSNFLDQPARATEPYARDVAISARRMFGLAAYPFDEAVRTGTFVRGRRHFDFRVHLGAAVGARVWSFRIERPDGSAALERSGPITWPMWHGHGVARWGYSIAFDQLGAWRLRWSLDGRELVNAPFTVVATRAEAVNRPPNDVRVSFTRPPTGGRALQCVVDASLVTEDPDYDIVRYRYRWLVGGAVVRETVSAGLSDVLRRDVVRSGVAVTCAVTPSDGRLDGATTSVSETAQ